jgi:raffinose/stachyose/melibiose transport system permease protein
VFAFLPALGVLAMSMTDISGILNVPWNWVGFDNYTRFLTGPEGEENRQIIWRTLQYCAIATVVQNILALGVAVLLNSRIKGRALFRAIVFLPVVLGVTVIGLIWSLMLNPNAGPGASLFEALGIQSAFLGDPDHAFYLIIGIQIWSSLGYSMVIYLAGLQAVPRELHEAARIDGASNWRGFRYVTLPMLAPAITANVLISIIGSLQAYQLIYVLAGNNPNTSVLALKVFNTGFQSNFSGSLGQEQGYASAISIIQFLLIGGIALVALAVLRRRETQL